MSLGGSVSGEVGEQGRGMIRLVILDPNAGIKADPTRNHRTERRTFLGGNDGFP
jgi:hypothetical protein